MKKHAGLMFKKWLSDRGIKISFASKKLGISYGHLINWMEGRYGISPKYAMKIEAFTNGDIKFYDCIAPYLPKGPLYVWGKKKKTFYQKNK